MKIKYLILAFALWLGPALSRAEDAKPLTDKKDKTSYGMGYNIGSAWKRQGIEASDVNLDVLLQGLRDATTGKSSTVSDPESRELLTAFQNELRTRREAKRKELGDKNKKEGETFLAENKAKPGVKTLPDGLQYKVLTEGSGDKPTTNDMVTVNYRGTLIDGTEFDSSYKRNQPATFRVTGVIKGWTEALQMMSPGAKWQLFIPSDLAYGERGSGANIGPNATLIFEVELVSVQPQPKPPTTTAPQQPVTSDIIKVPSADELKKGAKIEIIKPDQVEKEIEKEKQKQPQK
jgi:FKBP-type peptidyl-prolyl cis-trans isomerase FklB